MICYCAEQRIEYKCGRLVFFEEVTIVLGGVFVCIIDTGGPLILVTPRCIVCFFRLPRANRVL